MEYNFLNRQKPKRMIICKKCEQKKLHWAKELCSVCYAKIRNDKRAELTRLFI